MTTAMLDPVCVRCKERRATTNAALVSVTLIETWAVCDVCADIARALLCGRAVFARGSEPHPLIDAAEAHRKAAIDAHIDREYPIKPRCTEVVPFAGGEGTLPRRCALQAGHAGDHITKIQLGSMYGKRGG